MYNNHTDRFEEQCICHEKEESDIPNLYLENDDQLREYRNKYKYSTLHSGQYKLFLAEILFLTQYARENDHVVYAGAASFKHGKALFKLFPKITWTLIDPGKFDKIITKIAKKSDKVTIINDYFTEETAKEWKDQDFLFISDIRRDKDEEMVWEDMKLQKKLVEIMRPKVSMLKFRLPWNQKEVSYLNGHVLKQCYSPMSSTETRLIVDKKKHQFKEKIWDCKKYEHQMFYHNTITRMKNYAFANFITRSIKGMDKCWDCTVCTIIIMKYLNRFYKNISNKDIIEHIIGTTYDSIGRDLAQEYRKFYAKHLSKRSKYEDKSMEIRVFKKRIRKLKNKSEKIFLYKILKL
jgi:hypothetical protein